MQQFKTVTMDGLAAGLWDDIKTEAAKYPRSLITVERFNPERAISAQQMKWVHCEDGPIRIYSEIGHSLAESENYLKRQCGRQWFIVDITDDNWWESTGEIYYECRHSLCGQIFRPNLVRCIAGILRCKECGGKDIHLIAIKSKTGLTVNETTDWFNNMFDFMESIGHPVSKPNKNWRTTRKGKK